MVFRFALIAARTVPIDLDADGIDTPWWSAVSDRKSPFAKKRRVVRTYQNKQNQIIVVPKILPPPPQKKKNCCCCCKGKIDKILSMTYPTFLTYTTFSHYFNDSEQDMEVISISLQMKYTSYWNLRQRLNWSHSHRTLAFLWPKVQNCKTVMPDRNQCVSWSCTHVIDFREWYYIIWHNFNTF